MKKTLLIVGAILVGFIILAVAATPVEEVEYDNPVSGSTPVMVKDKSVSVPMESGYKEELYKEMEVGFMEGCMEAEGATIEDCECLFNSLDDQLGMDGMIKMSAGYLQTETIPEDVLLEAILTCY